MFHMLVMRVSILTVIKCFDTLLDDIPDNVAPISQVKDKATVVTSDADEWYGLEYTLELSCRERRASECDHDPSAGEHSKVRLLFISLRPLS